MMFTSTINWLNWVRAASMTSCILLCLSINVFGQESSVSGSVVDEETGEAIPGVTILVKGQSQGTVTDIDGQYNLNVPSGAVLSFSFVGYVTQEVAVGSRSVVDVGLPVDVQSLDEVVVVGYGTQKKSDVTGSLVTMDAEALAEIPSATNVFDGMQGRMAGVNIQSTSATPGGSPQIRIRGNRSLGSDESGVNNPLIVVDGIPYPGNINDLNPTTIASVNVLKDASATAIYGSRGANGVILVTTKRGAEGKPTLSLSSYYGFSSAIDKHEVFNATEYTQLREDSEYGGITGGDFTNDELASLAAARETDWQDLVYKNGHIASTNLSVSGGTEDTQYSFGLGYFDQTTVLPGQAFKRYSLQTSVDQKINDRIKVGISSQNTISYRDGETVSPMFWLLGLSPLYNPYDENGDINVLPAVGSQDPNVVNPLTIYKEGEWEEQRRRLRTFNTMYGEVNIVDGLKYRVNVGVDYSQDKYGRFRGQNTAFRNGQANDALVINQETFSYNVENLLIFNKDFGDHTIGFTGLYSVQEEESTRSQVNANGVFADFLSFNNLTLANTVLIDNGANGGNPYFKRRWGLMSGMGRVNYSYQDRFLLTATVRADGSSRLAEGNKWFTYPAIAVGWNLHNESFLESNSIFSNMKIRAGYGLTSNQAIAPYSSLGSLQRRVYNFGESGVYGYQVQNLPNENLTWEFTKSANVGLDYGFLQNRITGTVDFYLNTTTDVLQSRNLPSMAGITGNISENVGEVEGKGVEVMLNAAIFEEDNAGDFTMDVSLNFALHREQIVTLVDTITQDVGNGWFVGSPVNVIYDYEKVGIWQLGEEDEADAFDGSVPGTIRVADLDDDGVVTPDDRRIIGQLDPKWTAGFTTRFGYKGFDLSVVMYGNFGGTLVSTLYMSNQSNPLNSLTGRRNGVKVDYWTPNNPTNAYPEANNNDVKRYGGTLGYFDGTYVKVRSINLGYTLPQNWLEKVGLTSARVYFTADNPFKAFLSEYVDAGGLDPEPNRRAVQGNISPGLSRRLTVGASTPPVRSFIIGANLTF